MIGDGLYDTVRRRREAREEAQRRGRTQPPRPEGVTVYICRAVLEGPEYAELEEDERPTCGRIEERAPWKDIPWHHEQPMAITGYDWERDAPA